MTASCWLLLIFSTFVRFQAIHRTDEPKPSVVVPIKRDGDSQQRGVSWLSLNAQHVGVRFPSSPNEDRIVITDLKTGKEVASWTTARLSLFRRSKGPTCLLHASQRCLYYASGETVRVRYFGSWIPWDECIYNSPNGYLIESISGYLDEAICVSRKLESNQFQITQIPLNAKLQGRLRSVDIKPLSLDDTIVDTSPVGLGRLYCIRHSTKQPDDYNIINATGMEMSNFLTTENCPSRLSLSRQSILAIGTVSGKLRVIDTKSSKVLTDTRLGDSTIGSLAWSEDGKCLAVGLIGKSTSHQLFILNSPFKQLTFSSFVSKYGCEAVALTDYGDAVAAFGSDDIIRIWKFGKDK